uniref:Uncharacterized protein n=1 Tax=Anguilla anguilla TaxID=7936 RepID=A0A0E9P8V2_ANGAN
MGNLSHYSFVNVSVLKIVDPLSNSEHLMENVVTK